MSSQIPPCGYCKKDQCRICYKIRTDPAHAAHWGIKVETPEQIASPTNLGRCRYLGVATNELVQCSTCRGKVELKVFKCLNRQKSGYEECTLERPAAGLACCAGVRIPGGLAPCPGLDLSPVTPLEDNPRRKVVSQTWAYCVTTVPSRRRDLLPRTLKSLHKAGFTSPSLFVDGDKDSASWEREFNLPVVCRYPNLRSFGNWVLSAAELYLRNPKADRFAIFQDDFVTYYGLKEYLDSVRYPEDGYWNLYTFPENQDICPQGHIGWYPSNKRGLGAVALIFNRHWLLNLLTHLRLLERPLDPNRGWKAIDGGIVTSVRLMGGKEYVHNPSLVQHTGIQSSMGNRKHDLAVSFRGEDFDARTL